MRMLMLIAALPGGFMALSLRHRALIACLLLMATVAIAGVAIAGVAVGAGCAALLLMTPGGMARQRMLLLGCLLMVAGAVLNVGVAWVLIGHPYSWRPVVATRPSAIPPLVFAPSVTTLSSGVQPPATPEQLVNLTRRIGVPQDWPPAENGWITRELGRTRIFGVRADGAPTDWDGSRDEAGWPMRSMAVRMLRPARLNWVAQYSPSFRPRKSLLPSAAWFEDPYARVPLTPIAFGFTINTLFYASALALPMTFFPLRRRLRARRGRCTMCNYDRAGLEGPCPECGTLPIPGAGVPNPRSAEGPNAAQRQVGRDSLASPCATGEADETAAMP